MVNLSVVLNAVFQIAIIAVSLISINLMGSAIGMSTISILILLFLLILLYILFRKGYHRFAGFGMIVAISVIVTYNFIIGGGINDNAMVIFPVLIIMAGLVLGKGFIPYIVGVFFSEVSVIYGLTRAGIINPFDGAISVNFHNFLTVVILILMTGIVIYIKVLTLEKKFQQLVAAEDDLKNSYDLVIDGWGKALELFDRETEGHSKRVTEMTIKMAKELGISDDDQDHIRRGALLHDVGKMGISEEILNKKSSLTDKERAIIEKHPLHAYTLLKEIHFLEKALEIPLYHHERWNGEGYPYHLAGKDIPLAARIFTIVDHWDALTSDRPYRKAWPKDKVIQYIKNQSGKIFDPELVELFFESIQLK
jgi:putative nucleotidyltransferase with HDIG domain